MDQWRKARAAGIFWNLVLTDFLSPHCAVIMPRGVGKSMRKTSDHGTHDFASLVPFFLFSFPSLSFFFACLGLAELLLIG